MIDDAEFTVTHFQLQENDRLVLASDGIVEAMDEQGQLFGFARVQELLQSRLTAAEVATAAQSFGQQDDISVIAVTRTAVWFRPDLAGAAVTIAVSSPTMKSVAMSAKGGKPPEQPH